MYQTGTMDTQILTPASASLWYEALSMEVPSLTEGGQLAALLKTGRLRPHLRIVVWEEGKPFGRLRARLEEVGIRLWNAEFREGTSPDETYEAMRLMIGRVAAVRAEVGLSHLAIENRPGDDLKHNDLWLSALKREGYVETCTYRVYSRSLDLLQIPKPLPQAMTIHSIEQTDDGKFSTLYRAVKSITLEQRDIDREKPERAINNMKKVGRGYDKALWLLACLEGNAVGYALANLADEEQFPDKSAWLVDIGCIPEQRSKGIASALLSEIAKRLKLAGAQRLLAAIDDINVPSKRLHLSYGFMARPIRHYIYRLV
jgi:GNAT superfamily N-acetyltransferase